MSTAESHNIHMSKSNGSLGHRRQASIGLGIITNLETANENKDTLVHSTKNASFFETSDNSIPRPPPILEPKQHNISNSNHSTTPLESGTTYASRLRNIAISSSQLSPTPNKVNDPKVRRARSYRLRPHHYRRGEDDKNGEDDINDDDDDDDDNIMPLPSPLPTNSTTSTHRLPQQHHHDHHLQTSHTITRTLPHSPVTPPSPSTSTSIPIIAISPTFVHKDDVIPRLSEHPMLGDMDEKSYDDTKRRMGGMVRETTQSSALPTLGGQDEELVDKQLGDFYIRRLLGMGAFSKVYLAERHHRPSELFAIKTINKTGMLKNPRVRCSIEREVGVLKFIDHPHIVRIEATMETEHSLCIILEYAEGIELFDFVQQLHQRLHENNEPVNETLVKKIFLQLVRVVKWMHRHNIVHRDLKLENILIQMKDEQQEPVLKVTDFGLARVIDPDSPILTTRCGSEEYAAPEIVQSKGYDGRQTDTWALGVILYSLLVGYLPFRYDVSKGERVTQMFYRIVRAQVKWPHHAQISPEAKQVVEKILVRQPEHRIHLDDIEALPWFQRQ